MSIQKCMPGLYPTKGLTSRQPFIISKTLHWLLEKT